MHARHHYDLRGASKWSAAAVLPGQFFDPAGGVATRRGVVALMRAVLEDAVHCLRQQFLKSGRRAQRLTREVEEWFFADDPHWVFSFVYICAVLGFDSAYLRRGLRQWRRRHKEQALRTEVEQFLERLSMFGTPLIDGSSVYPTGSRRRKR